MPNFQVKGCTSCGSLKEIYNEVECTLIDLIRKKWTNAQYNTSLSFNQRLYKDLVRYKRVVYNRMFNPSYPASCIDVQDVITQARLRAYKGGGCSQCSSCFPPDESSTSSTSSSTSTSSTTNA